MGQNHSFGLASKFKSLRRGKPTQTMTPAEAKTEEEAEIGNRHGRGHGPSNSSHIAASPPKISFLEALPRELFLHILSFMDLKTLIAASGVCQEWRASLSLPHAVAGINPVRHRLYLLFRSMLATPCFEKTRPWIVGHLRPFNRGWFVDAVRVQSGHDVPPEFEMWIMEWPAKMAINSLWPGLPFCDSYMDSSVQRTHGVNWLGQAPPQLSAVVYQYGIGKGEAKYVPGLLLWRGDFNSHWLMLDKEEPGLYGRVVITTCNLTESASTIPRGFMDRDGFGFYGGGNGDGNCANGVYSDWIEFQEWEWEMMKRRIARESTDSNSKWMNVGVDSRKSVGCVGFYRVDIELGSQRPFELLCPPWMRRHEDKFVRYLNSIN